MLSRPARIAVFASGGGTNLQALLDHFTIGGSPSATVELVVASRDKVGAIARAADAGVAHRVIDPILLGDRLAATEMLRSLDAFEIDLIALAGYLKLIPVEVVERFRGRILNIHPALLPAFGGAGMYGIRVHQAVIASGATVSGATVHLVDERYDEGRIIAQWPVPVLRNDTPEALAARVLRVEHLLYPAALESVIMEASGASPDELSFEIADAAAPAGSSIERLLR